MKLANLDEANKFLSQVLGDKLVFGVEDLARLLDRRPQTIRNDIARKRFVIETRRLQGRRVADRCAVVEWFFCFSNGYQMPVRRRGRPRKDVGPQWPHAGIVSGSCGHSE